MNSGENGGLEGILGSSPGRSFLAPGIAYFDWVGQGGSERETGSIESEGDLRGGSWWARARFGDSENLGFFTKFMVSHFSL